MDVGNEEELNTWGSPVAPQQVLFDPSSAFKDMQSEEDSDSDRSGDGWQSTTRSVAARRQRQDRTVDEPHGSLTKKQRFIDYSPVAHARIPSSDDTIVSGNDEVLFKTETMPLSSMHFRFH